MLVVDLVTTDKSRVFIAPKGAKGNTEYDYHNTMFLGGLNKTFGDVENVTIQHPSQYRKFITVDKIVTANPSNWTTSLTGRFLLKKKSALLTLAQCEGIFDLQCHLGQCVDPTDFNEFDLAIILENAKITDYSTDPLGTLEQSGVSVVNETVSLSCENVFYIYNRPFASIQHELLSYGPIVDMVAVQNTDCTDGCDNCDKLIALQVPNPLTATNVLHLLISNDGGINWDMVTFTMAIDANHEYGTYNLATDGLYVYVFTNSTLGGKGYLYKIAIKDIESGSGTVTPSFAALHASSIFNVFNDGSQIITVGDLGVVQKVNGNQLSATQLANNITTLDLLSVHGLSVDHFIIGGQEDTLIEYNLSTGFRKIDINVGENDINAVWMKDTLNWIVGTDTGDVYTTTNGGKTWTNVTPFDVNCVSHISFPTKNIGYITAHVNTGEKIIYRTLDGGATWKKLINSDSATASDATIFGVVTCKSDPSKYVTYGMESASGDISCIHKGGYPTNDHQGVITIPLEL